MEPVSVEIIQGKGEYAITSANVKKLAAACRDYQKTGNWKWCLQDCLGIKSDGNFGPRFARIQTELKDSSDEDVIDLLIAMSEVTKKEPSEIKRTLRTSYSAPVAAPSAAAKPTAIPSTTPAKPVTESDAVDDLTSVEDLLEEVPESAAAEA